MWFSEKEALAPLDAPESCSGDPSPRVLADEQGLVFGYRLSPRFIGNDPALSAPAADFDEPCAIAFASPCFALTFGGPNDEALGGHRLARLGLRPWSSYEVFNSAWIGDMERANAVHSRHDKAVFLKGKRHFVFTFKDSTLEFVARDVTFRLARGPIGPLLSESLALNGAR